MNFMIFTDETETVFRFYFQQGFKFVNYPFPYEVAKIAQSVLKKNIAMDCRRLNRHSPEVGYRRVMGNQKYKQLHYSSICGNRVTLHRHRLKSLLKFWMAVAKEEARLACFKLINDLRVILNRNAWFPKTRYLMSFRFFSSNLKCSRRRGLKKGRFLRVRMASTMSWRGTDKTRRRLLLIKETLRSKWSRRSSVKI